MKPILLLVTTLLLVPLVGLHTADAQESLGRTTGVRNR
jgi:hypothetical protein